MSTATAVVDADDAFEGDGAGTAAPPRLRLTALSFLMLFLELALIRWSASNNIHLAYLTNFVLLASFLGIGAGFLAARRRIELFPFAPVVLAVLAGFVLAFPVRMPALGTHAYQLRGNFASPPLHKRVSR